MQVIVMPNLLNNSVYVTGLRNPLEAVAEVLDVQGKYEYAKALRDAATICETYAKVNITGEAKLQKPA